MENKNYSCLHDASLIGVFLIGNMFISISKPSAFLGLLFAALLAFFLVGILVKIQSANSNFRAEMFASSYLNKLQKTVLLTVLTAFLLIIYIISSNDYVSIVDSIRLPNTSRFLITLIFISLSVIMAFSRKNVIYAFAFTSAIFLLGTTLIMWILSIPNMRLEVFKEILNINITETFWDALGIFAKSFGQIIIIILFIGYRGVSYARKSQFLGIGFAALILMICFSNTFLLLGNRIINEVNFPYAAATGIITVGKNFSRLDGFTYYNYFILSLIKMTVVYKTVLSISKNLNKSFYIISAVSFPVICLIITSFNFTDEVVKSNYMVYILLGFEVLVTLLFFLFTRKPVKK